MISYKDTNVERDAAATSGLYVRQYGYGMDKFLQGINIIIRLETNTKLPLRT